MALLATGLCAALVVSGLSVALVRTLTDGVGPYDVAGDPVATSLDGPDPMERPEQPGGVKLGEPGAAEEVRGMPAARAARPPVKSKVSCETATEADLLGGGVTKGSRVCRSSATRQAPDATDAPRFRLAPGSKAAPMPTPAPSSPRGRTAGEDDDDDASTPAPGGGGTSDPQAERDVSTRSEPMSSVEGTVPGARSPPAEARPAAAPAVLPAGEGEFLSPNWVLASPAHQPTGYVQSVAAWDETRKRVVLFGGLTGDGLSNETWVWDGVDWTQMHPTTSPPPRRRSAMAWDPVTQRVIMYGGQLSDTSFYDDVWAWDGTDWTELTTTGTTTPVARGGHAMAYDPVREAMVVFGGQAATGDRNDSWQLDGTTWSPIQANGASGAPAVRANTRMAYSQSTSQLLLFGGGQGDCPSPCTSYDDTWVLGATASAWTEQSPTHVPAERRDHAMTYHEGLGAVVMFGGMNGDGTTSSYLNDTWAWTGDDWEQASGIASPGGRRGAAMAALDRGQMVLFGGSGASPELEAETWTWDTSIPLLEVEATGGTGQAPVFWVGDSVQIAIRAINTGVKPIDPADGVTITSALQQTLLAAGTKIGFGDDDELEACTQPAATLCGGVADLTTTIANIAIPGSGTRVGDFVATAVGTQKGCELIDIPAVVSGLLGGSQQASTQITVCGGGLGLEDWWTYDTTDLGSGGTASVNAANGNLVVKQYDTDPVQTRGSLAIGLGRVYNSQDLMSGGGPIGAGWQFDIGETGLTAGGFGIAGLKLPNLQSLTQPLSMPYVDRDGTRHVFRLRSIGAAIGETSVPIDLTEGGDPAAAIRELLNPATLPWTLTSTVEGLEYTSLCIDQAYTGPPGSNMFLFRYIGVGSKDACGNPVDNGGVKIGWSLVRPDRLRYDFNAFGDLVQVTDPTGQQLIYTPGIAYGPTKIHTRACGGNGKCPTITIDYNAPGAPAGHRHVKVTDTAGRITSYLVTNDDPLLPLLTQVWEPGNPLSDAPGATPTASYTYATATVPCPGTSGAGTVGQLCLVTDAHGEKTTFAYTPAPLGPDRVWKVTDRAGNASGVLGTSGLTTVYGWHDAELGPGGEPEVGWTGVDYVTADTATPMVTNACGTSCHRTRYSAVDAYGRVGEIAEGTSDNTYVRQAGYFWDGGAIESCTLTGNGVATGVVNHNLCRTIRRAVPEETPILPTEAKTVTVNAVRVHSEGTDYTYGELGQLLRQRVLTDADKGWTAAGTAVTTWGTHDQYFDANGRARAYTNQVRGSGNVASSAGPGNYRGAVLADDPAAYWRLAEKTTDTTMSSETGSNNGSYTAPGRAGLGAEGALGGNTALSEPTGGGFAANVTALSGFAHGTTAADSDFTIEAWQRTTDVTGQEVALQWGPSGNSYGAVGRTYGGLPMISLVSNAGTGAQATVYATASIADGTWHHVVYTYDGSGTTAGMRILIDGEPAPLAVYADTLGGAFATVTSPALVGKASAGGAASSSLDEVSAYPRVLPDTRIRAHREAALGGRRVHADTLYAVTDTTQELTPRGNVANTPWGEYLTTTRRDLPAEGEIAPTNTPAGPTICGTADRGNTGLVCEVDTPASAGVAAGVCDSPTQDPPTGSPTPPTDPGYAHACTTYTYNAAGQRTGMVTPKANAASDPAGYQYVYYDDTTSCAPADEDSDGQDQSNCDLSGSVSAGGWLKAVIDPAGEKVVYAYDAAGNPARTWERNATHGKSLEAAWTDPEAPPSSAYAEDLHATPITSDALSVSNTALVAVGPDGTALGSGTNASGELGDRSTTARGTATTVGAGLNRVVQVTQSATGALSGCSITSFLTAQGEVWQAGQGVSTPAKVGVLEDVISIASGGCHTLALDAQGRLWAWGNNGQGQIGNGSTSPVPPSAPVKVLDKVSTMAAGYLHSLAVTTDGKTWAWGANNAGQLGLGDTTGRNTPTEVPELTGLRAVSAGLASSFGIRRDGSVWAWGENSTGDLGLGDTTDHTSPVRSTQLGTGTPGGAVRQIVGAAYGGAALTTTGRIRVWGLNNTSQLGGATTDPSSSTPLEIPDLTDQRALAGGWGTYAAADGAGDVRVWGATGNRQRGDGTNPPTTTTPTVAGHDLSPYRTPGFALRGTRDQVGNLTTQTVDDLDRVVRTRSGRGHAVWTSAFDTATGYDAAGRPTWSTGAQHRSTTTVASVTYDAWGNPIKTVDARGIARRASYDVVDRQLTSQVTRGPAAESPATCTTTATTNAWTAGQNGHRVCRTTTTWSATDRQITLTDAASQTTRAGYDAAGRQTRQVTPRANGGITTAVTRWVYDPDGNVTDVCPPRQFDAAHEDNTTGDNANGCTATAVHSVHQIIDRAGRARAQTRYRAGGGSPTALTSTTRYDADGNPIEATDPEGRVTNATYDLQGRRLTQTVHRSPTRPLVTRWTYDPSGNVTAIASPGLTNTGTGADGPLVVDGQTAGNSTDGVAHGAGNPFQIPDGADYTDVTLQNGAHVTAADAHGLVFTATGALSVCEDCVITMAGRGQAGGAEGGTAGANGASGGDADNPAPEGNGGLGGAGNSGGNGSGGGGGGHKEAGGNGAGPTTPGTGGSASGSSDFADVGSDYLEGSGGGGGGGGRGLLANAGAGGDGGGYIRITATTIDIAGTITAAGQAGGTALTSSGGGGGGAGGGIWLAAGDVDLPAPGGSTGLNVTGGAGGNAGGRNGGNGSEGYIRIDADQVTNAPAGIDRRRAAMVTAVSYDPANRPVDTVEGALTFQADPALDATKAAVPDRNGLANTRTRTLYDADGRIAAVLPPGAFSNAASLTAPDTDRARRVDYDLDGNPIRTYSPRYRDGAEASIDSGAGGDGGTGADQQATQCTTERITDHVDGLETYGTDVGVCVTRTSYDPVGNVDRQWLPSSNGTGNGYLAYTYTGDNLPRTLTGPDPSDATSGDAGRVTVGTYTYDGPGRVTAVTDALGHLSQTAYTADGLTAQTTGQSYTDGGSTVTETTSFTYDAGGNPKTVTNPTGDVTTQAWTTDNLTASITAPGPTASTDAVTRYEYDKVGNPVRVWTPQATADGTRPVVNQYTGDNLLAATHTPITASTTRTVRYGYSPAGLKASTNTGRCTSATVADCEPGNAAWHSAGAMRVTYGMNGRVAEQYGRDDTAVTTAYTQDGGPVRVKDPLSRITLTAGYYLDDLPRRVEEQTTGTGAAGAAVNTNTYAYDASGQPTVRTDKTPAGGVTDGATVTTSYAYNTAGLPVATHSGVLDDTTTYVYDDAGRPTTAATGGTGGHVTQWSWHPNDALAGIKTSAEGATVAEHTYGYDNNRNITRQTATGPGTAGGYTNTYAYTPAQQVASWTHNPGGGSSSTTSYGWDRNSNRTSATASGVTVSWNYRQDNSIATQTTPTGTRDYTYNDAGLLVDDDCSTYTYDRFDRTKVVDTDNSALCGTDVGRRTTYTYDGLDRQRTIEVTGAHDAGENGTTRNVYNGLTTNLVGQTGAVNGADSRPDVLYQLDATGTQVAYDQTGGTGGTGAGKAFLDTDGQGNVTTLTGPGGGIACAVAYDPFGQAHAPSTAADANDMCQPGGSGVQESGNAIWYRGQTRDGSTGDYQLGTRTYDPATGAFTTPDSYRVSSSATDLSLTTDPLTANTYTYVNGNPINAIDSDGHAPSCVLDGSHGNCQYYDTGPGGVVPRPKNASDTRREAADDVVYNQAKVQATQKKLDKGFDWGGAIKTFLGEVSGYTDLKNCVTQGDVMACAWTALSLIGGVAWKVGKFAKGAKALIKAYKIFNDTRGVLRRTLSTATNALAKAQAKLKALRRTADDLPASRKVAAADGLPAPKTKPGHTADSPGVRRSADEPGGGAGHSCRFRSFAGATLVLMADGTHKPIKNIRPGDRVLATNPETGVQRAKRVTHVWVHDDTLTDLVLDHGLRVTTTEDHPFWNATDHTWQDTQDLAPGDTLLTAQWDRRDVVGLDPGTQHKGTAYNLTVTGLHTYHVTTSDLLVHNCGDGKTPDKPTTTNPKPTSTSAANAERRVFSNLGPGDPIRANGFQAINPSSLGNTSGRFNYIVGTDGRLVIANRRYGHIDLANGGDVLAAGEFRVVNGVVRSINNGSGHYKPFGPSAQTAAEEAFGSSGLIVRPGAYSEIVP